MSTYILWHNAKCSKSRAALELLRDRGIEPAIRTYLDDPPSADELAAVAHMLGSARVLLRDGEPEFVALGLSRDDLGDDALIAAMAAHPSLIQRPILIQAGAPASRAVIGRPTERLVSFLDS